MRDAKWQESVLNSVKKRDATSNKGAVSFLACGCGCGPSAYIQLTRAEMQPRLPSEIKRTRNNGFGNKQMDKK